MRPAAALSSAAEHAALAEAIAGLADRLHLRSQSRTAFDSPQDRIPDGWQDLAAAELLAIAWDGELLDVAVVAAELGRALAAGPVVPTLVAGVLVRRHGDPQLQELLESGLRDGSVTVAVEMPGTDLLLGGAAVSHLLASSPAGWVLAPATALTSVPGIDPSRRCAAKPTTIEGAVLQGVTDDDVRLLMTCLLAAEACGIAAWCVGSAVDYAKVREQFGQAIGGFQAVKHRCADLFCDLELALAAAWDAASALGDPDAPKQEVELAVSVAGAVALETSVGAAKGLIQVLGGIGYTWEHDAHLYFKRAVATRALTGGAAPFRRRAAELALAGVRRNHSFELGAEAAGFRSAVKEFIASLSGLEGRDLRVAIADGGYLTPHWPAPYGRDAGPVEQLVIDEEFGAAGIQRPDLVIGNWAVPTIVAHGNDQQRERFVRPTLYGDISWCQMFSEPGAGSDLASLSTKAVKVDGGWSLSGQKVWTSSAQRADWAVCLARTSTGAKRHDGITYFLVDMKTPGLDIRPLRELTGEALFNEIFLTDVFVPDDCVVGEVDGGWRLARTTLANERVAMSSGSAFPSGIEEVLRAVSASGLAGDGDVLAKVGELLCLAQADAMLGTRAILARVSGTDPGAASSVRKSVGMHLRQDAAELTLELLGPAAVQAADADAAAAVHKLYQTRSLTIAGGTSEILKNVIGERILGLPR